ncbi:MAG: chitobiase/beta-hexosaminidase C-terminal domain-containing protein, partial [Armatimonadota bacterium]
YDGYNTLFLDLLRSSTSDVPIPPAAASNPGVTDIASDSLRWTWQDNSATETGFNVYTDPGAGPPATLRTTTAAGATSWTNTGLNADGVYAFQVTAANGVSQSLKTVTVSAITLPAPPSVGNNISSDKTTAQSYALGSVFTFTNPAGFGVDGLFRVTAFQYVWDAIPTHAWIGSEPVWSNADLIQTPTQAGSYYLHLASVGQAGAMNAMTLDYGPFIIDTTLPTSCANPVGGVYKGPLSVQLTASEPGNIYYTTNGTEPTAASGVYSFPLSLTADTIVKFYAVDGASNAEASKHTESYKIVSSDNSIGSVKLQTPGSAVRLADKYLYWKSGTLGYIEDKDRASGIRVFSAALPSEGTICLTGTLQKISVNEFRIVVDAVTRTGSGIPAALGANMNTLKLPLMSGLFVRAWGSVMPGSVAVGSFYLSDGSDESGLRILTAGAPPVVEWQLVGVTGALGYIGAPVIYAKEITVY